MRFIFLMLVFLPTFAWAQVYLTERDSEVWVSSHMDFYEDKQDTLTIAHIGKATFQPMRIPLYSFGLSNSSFWLKITVENTSSFKDWLLTIDFAQHSYIDLYTQNLEGDWIKQKHGFTLRHGTRPIFHNFFAFPVDVTKTPQTFYLRIKTDRACTFPVSLVRTHTFIKNKTYLDIYYGIYIGIFLGLLVYNALLWIGLRDINYLYYVITIFAFFSIHTT
ncbi:MAG: hypothetical protein EAZ95_06445 [Bacteroidetes bacterium]|nr:MAG: hypothetical protein EAZ95_06445 [Bacteroidota bacterium]